MTCRQLIPISFDGIGLTHVGRQAVFEYDDGSHDAPRHEGVLAERSGAFPRYVYSQPQAKTFPLTFYISSPDTEGQFRDLSRIFNPRDGERVLVVEDSDGVRKRLTCVPQQLVMPAATANKVVVPLLAADPLLYDSDEDTVVGTVQTTSAVSLPAHNLGSYRTMPTITARPGVLRTALQAWTRGYEVQYVSRSPLPLAAFGGQGKWLLDVTNGGLDTSAIVNVAAISTTLNQVGGIAIGAAPPFDITVAATAGFDNEGILYFPTADEQMEYTVKNATEFTISARALGGTVAVAHANGATIRQSRMLKDGRDIAVFIDHVQVPPERVFLGGMNTAATKIWVEINDIAAVSVTPLTISLVAGTVYDIVFASAHPFVEGDYVMGASLRVARVVSVIDSRTVRVETAVRGFASQAPSGVGLYRQGHFIQIAHNWSRAPIRVLGFAPLIDLVNSTNGQWIWPTTLADSRRPCSWRAIAYEGREDVPALRRNLLAQKTCLLGSWDGFVDDEPTTKQPAFDAIEFASGIPTTSLRYDATVGLTFALQTIARDLLGLDVLVASRMGHDAGGGADSHEGDSASYVNQSETITDAQALILRARNVILSGYISPSGTDVTVGTVGSPGQGPSNLFVLDADTPIHGIVTKVKRTVAGTTNYGVVLYTVGSDGSWFLITAYGFAPASHPLTSTVYILVCIFPDPAIFPAAPLLPPGSYHLLPMAAATNVRELKSFDRQYLRGAFWGVTGIEEPTYNIPFLLLSWLADNQSDVLLAPRTVGTTGSLTLSDVNVVFNTDYTPLLKLVAGAYYYLDDIYAMNGVEVAHLRLLRRDGLQVGGGVENGVEIDFAAGTVISGTSSTSLAEGTQDIRAALEIITEPGAALEPGINALTVQVATGAPAEVHTVAFRSAWQA